MREAGQADQADQEVLTRGCRERIGEYDELAVPVPSAASSSTGSARISAVGSLGRPAMSGGTMHRGATAFIRSGAWWR